MIWRVTDIAASDHPGKVDLIRKIILASASIPAAFPPVAFEVEANGRHYDELHVDGGAVSQVFLYPAAIDWARVLEKLESPAKPKVYVIRNSRLDPRGTTVNRKLFAIAGRTISSLIRTQGVGDLYRIYAQSQRDSLEFNLAFIPESRAGYPWGNSPPGFESREED